MSVLSHLVQRASAAVLSSTENSSITTSITTLRQRLDAYFTTSLFERFQFGSSTRGTILPRNMDAHSDIDYMVVFNDRGYRPQTYLDRLSKFVNYYYSRSDVRQSSPTIMLELNHIKFELVPALKAQWGNGYEIPNGTEAWQSTDPNDFNQSLTTKNNAEKSLIKPTIRLAKYWNALNDYPFDSYLFEKWIVERYFYNCSNQKEYLFAVFDALNPGLEQTQWRKNKMQRAKDIIAQIREYERQGYSALAETEIQKLIP